MREGFAAAWAVGVVRISDPGFRFEHLPMANRARVFAFSLSGVVLLSSFGGCYRPAGSYYPGTGQGYTYISTEMKPVTITLVDTRTEQPFFKLDIPVGKQLSFNFLGGKGDDPVTRPDRLTYAIWESNTETGRLTNQLTCPPQDCVRIDYSLRKAPEWAETPPEYMHRIDAPQGAPAWWTPAGGPVPAKNRPLYE